MEILGNVKNYAWGKLGGSSIVAQLAKSNDDKFEINPTESYAELWMGDHSSGPALIKATGEELGKHTDSTLPFLFKVLSIRKALSIQAHPNKQEAEWLHHNHPDHYPDANHKPELAIALTPFTALLGFRPYEEIIKFINELPPLKGLLGEAADLAALRRGNKQDLRDCYKICMTASEEAVQNFVAEIFRMHTHELQQYGLLEIFKTIARDFPSDCGILSLFFLNLIKLQEGEAIFLPANEIHAYLDGDCIECMARSDNVIRAGLTPKYKDVEQLLFCLNYTGQRPECLLFKPKCISPQLQIFSPPIEDFAVLKIRLTDGEPFKLPLKAYPSIMIVLAGSRMLHLESCCPLALKRGSVVYIAAKDAHSIEFSVGKLCSAEPGTFVAYLASYNFYLEETKKSVSSIKTK